jgi:phage gpG-like protein
VDFKKKILTDLKVKLSEEFDRNFERKAFFSQPWAGRKNERHGTTLMVGGALRKSILSRAEGDAVKWTSSLPYAGIHNDGGTIAVTARMKRFFWAKYYELAGRVTYRRDGTTPTASSRGIAEEALLFKGLALKKVGDKITIPERRFIGDAPEVAEAVERVVELNMKELEEYIANLLRN